ncbi:hypothetical protein BDV27DRAFT_143027 [Aspergillus caelatus]|uniref:Protein kinase domain-containing protein n=1 Tax=Aspergillus caelatus TaxID=61420 RepID=A0A5N7ABD3_9EURO|nr:uncharacterized protein BDV27DRAFT_143027 [Aspergillus caelatus]KAE8367142.1 hypothetical protein BDV27DRAFT_143027 [Aspergillus caelatus]
MFKIIQDVQDTSHLVTYLATFLLPRPGDNGYHRKIYTKPELYIAVNLNEKNCMWGITPLHDLNRSYPPMEFCSPERLHGKHPNFACDMWSYMVYFGVLYLNGYSPFSTVAHGGVISDIGKTPEPTRNLASTIAYSRPDADPIERGLVHSIMLKIFTSALYCCYRSH